MADRPAGVLRQNICSAEDAEVSRSVSDQDLLCRFLAHRDEAAFAALVQRYSGTVWSVCRRILPQQQDAEDAFQAVFFLLARKADTIHKKEAVGSWLYGVAYRVAMKARRTAGRRQRREKKPRPTTPEPVPSSEAASRELQRVLDEEVQRLADKYRAPFVLCCLEGMSKAEAARELGWKEGTVSWRLGQARALLQKRLLRRGVTLSAALTVLALLPYKASVSAALIQTTTQGVLATLVGQAAALSPNAVALANGMMRSLAMTRGKLFLAVVLTLMVLMEGACLGAYLANPDTQQAAPQRIATQPVPTHLIGPPGKPGEPAVVSVALSADGKRLATTVGRVAEPGQLNIRDTATVEDLVALKPEVGPSTAAFSPDDHTLATGTFQGDIVLRAAEDGHEQTVLHGSATSVHGLAFSPSGAELASAAADGTVTVWNVKNRRAQQSMHGHSDSVRAVAFFHREQALVSGSDDFTAKIWDAGTGKEKFTLRGHQSRIDAVAVSPDDRLVATGSMDRTLRLWDAETGKEAAVLEGQPRGLCSIAFSPNGQLLASGDVNGNVCLWEVKTYRLLRRLVRQTAAIRTLVFSADGRYLHTGSAAGPVLFSLGCLDGGSSSNEESFQEYYQSFKNGVGMPAGWQLRGPEPEQGIHCEPAGLRLTLPPGKPPQESGAGVGTPLCLQGDFEITMAFEILQEPPPAEAGTTQTRVSLEILLDRQTDSANMASLSRRMAADGSHFFVWQVTRTKENGPEKTADRLHYSTATTGRLRLSRLGNLLSYCVADGLEGEFTLLKQCPFGSENVKEVRLVGATGDPGAALDVRITEVRIQAQALPNLAEMQGSAAASSEEKTGEERAKKRRRLAAEVLALVAAVGGIIALGIWPFGRHNRSGLVAAAPAKADPAAVVSFACADCGKNLKAKAELVGKKVKCSQCGKGVLVPPPQEVTVESPAPGKMWPRLALLGGFVVLGLTACATGWLAYLSSPSGSVSNQVQPLDASQYLDRLLGNEEIRGVAEEGFSWEEGGNGTPRYRWTNGAAKLVVPLNGPPPKAMHVRLVAVRNNYRIHIRVNGQSLFNERVSVRDWARTFDLSSMNLGAAVTVEILSDTFVPAEMEKGNGDERTLGVRVQGVTLLSGTQEYTDVPLGVQDTPGVRESGFHGPEKFRLPGMESDQPSRWTDGSARLTVPLPGKKPRSLALSLEVPNVPEYRLQVTVNGQKLFDEVISTPNWQLYWSIELPLAGVDLGDSAYIELDSSTFIPAQKGSNSKDTRKLGVRVKRLILATDATAQQK